MICYWWLKKAFKAECVKWYIYAKGNNKNMKNYDQNIDSSYLMYLDANNLYGWAMYQKLPVGGFEWVEDSPKFNEDFIKHYDENSNKGYFVKVDVKYPKKVFNSQKDFMFLPEREKIEKCENLVCSMKDKQNMLFT